jgi:hypothetical protein
MPRRLVHMESGFNTDLVDGSRSLCHLLLMPSWLSLSYSIAAHAHLVRSRTTIPRSSRREDQDPAAFEDTSSCKSADISSSSRVRPRSLPRV